MKIEVHQNFLDNIQSYKAAKTFWKSTIEGIAGDSYQNWVENTYSNGSEIMDGNPLFSVRFNDKAIRIIQNKRNSEQAKFIAWLDKASLDNKDISELVIALQPYKTPFNDATSLIKMFLQEDPKTGDSLVRLIQKYEYEWKKKQLIDVVKFIEKTELEKDKWNLNEKLLFSDNFSPNFLKQIVHISDLISSIEIVNVKLSRTFELLSKSMSDLASTITLKGNFDAVKFEEFNREEYLKQLASKFSNIHNYLLSYNSKVYKVEINYKKLKEHNVEELLEKETN